MFGYGCNSRSTIHPTPTPCYKLYICYLQTLNRQVWIFITIVNHYTFRKLFFIIDQFTISGLIITVIIREAMRGMETIPPPGYFRSYIGKSVGV